jgi:hypothetical protein
MSLSLSLKLALECPVCKQYWGSDTEGEIQAALFGYKNFGICPNCGQRVDNEDKGYFDSYLKRAKKWVLTHSKSNIESRYD